MKNKVNPHKTDGNTDTEGHQISKLIKKDCLRLLARRDHSRKEIQRKLADKGYQPDQVVSVIDELAQHSWQDDTRYAENFARVRSQKGMGPIRIAYELKQQGIESRTVEKVLRTTTDNWMVLLAQVYTKKYPESSVLDNNERAKRTRFLTQRGFSSAMISTFFNQLTKQYS